MCIIIFYIMIQTTLEERHDCSNFGKGSFEMIRDRIELSQQKKHRGEQPCRCVLDPSDENDRKRSCVATDCRSVPGGINGLVAAVSFL